MPITSSGTLIWYPIGVPDQHGLAQRYEFCRCTLSLRRRVSFVALAKKDSLAFLPRFALLRITLRRAFLHFRAKTSLFASLASRRRGVTPYPAPLDFSRGCARTFLTPVSQGATIWRRRTLYNILRNVLDFTRPTRTCQLLCTYGVIGAFVEEEL